MRPRITRSLVIPVLAGALLAVGFIAAAPANAQRADRVQQVHTANRLVSIDFKGGFTAQYYDALQQALGDHVVVIMPGAETVVMPPVKLTNVPFGEAVRVAKYVRGETRIDVESEGQTWVVVPRDADGFDTSTLVKTVTWSVAEIVKEDGLSADSLMSAVHATNQLHGGEPEMRYHDEAKLLIARGTQAELASIDQTLDSAHDSIRAAEHAQETEVERDLKAQLREAQQEISRLKLHIHHLENELASRNR